MVEKIFCPNCNHNADFTVKKREITSFRGVELNTFENVAVCNECGNDISVFELDDENLKRLYREYKLKTDMVLPEDISCFRKERSISRRELTSILGWGKMTLNRYENGALQSKAHDEILRSVINNEEHFVDMVNRAYEDGRIRQRTKNKAVSVSGKKNKDSEQARIFESGCAKPDIYNGFKKVDIDKIQNLIGYVTDVMGIQAKTAINKILFFIDFCYYSDMNTSITGLKYQRYPRGPYIGRARNNLLVEFDEYYTTQFEEIGDNECHYFESRENYDLSMFSEQEMKVINDVCERLKGMNATEMSNLSHEEKAWIDTIPYEYISYEYAHDLNLFKDDN